MDLSGCRVPTFGARLLFSGMMLGGLLMLREQGARLGALLFFLCFTYVELLDKSNYLNHYYFVSLVAFMLIWLPTTWRTPQVPKVVVFSFGSCWGWSMATRGWPSSTQIGCACPASCHVASPAQRSARLGKFFAMREVAFLFSWAGAAFDLVAPFALFSDRVRPYFYPILVTFHVLTWVLFPIGVFPWVMIACTTVFFTDSWHEALWAKLQKWLPQSKLTPTE